MASEQRLSESELDPDSHTNTDAKGDGAAIGRRPMGLVSQADLDALSQRTDLPGLVYFCVHYCLILGGAWLTLRTFGGPIFVPVFLLHAYIIGFLFSPLHECAHGTAFRTRWLNETVLWITAFVYIIPPYYFRYFHLGHHRYTQVPGKDPSLVLPEPSTFKQYLWYCAGLWFWWRNITWMLKHAAGVLDPVSAPYVPKAKRRLMILESRIMVVFYLTVIAAAIYFGLGFALIVCWLLPRLIGEPIQRIMRVAEHVGCEESADLLNNTRTTITNRFVNAIAWQMPYHAEHHLFPNVPFHGLPSLHEKVKSKIAVESRGYIYGQREIITMLRAPGRDTSGSKAAPRPLL